MRLRDLQQILDRFTNGQKGTIISDCPVYIETMSGHLEDVRRIEIQESNLIGDANPARLVIKADKNEMAVIDFKQTNKPKKREWVEDYCLQLAAYGMAHDFVYRTAITKAVIMMCSKDNYYQEFVIEGAEYRKYKHKWLGRVDEYYKGRSKKVG